MLANCSTPLHLFVVHAGSILNKLQFIHPGFDSYRTMKLNGSSDANLQHHSAKLTL